MIKYLGSKRLLLSAIVDLVGAIGGVRSVADLFSGTSRVGHALKGEGYRVVANDHNAYAATLARCYVEADLEDVRDEATRIIAELNAMPGKRGFVTETFCENARYFQPKNGERIDAMRDAIEKMSLAPDLKAVVLVSLMEAADRVDSTTGVQMAYLKQWSARSHQDISLRMPNVLSRAAAGKSAVLEGDALQAASAVQTDVTYLDPPYNQHKYLGNYHVWETLVRWDAPEVYGRAQKRIDCKTRQSAFNSRRTFRATFEELISRVRSPWMIVSFSDEGFLPRAELESILSTRGVVGVTEHAYRRYVGAQIGVYNPRGERVGKPTHLKNREFLFLVAPTQRELSRVMKDVESKVG